MSDFDMTDAPVSGHVAPSDDAMDVDHSEFHLALDYGTRNLGVACRVASDTDVYPQEVFDVFGDRVGASIPQIIGFGPAPEGKLRGNFYWGQDAEDAIARGDVPYENIIVLWKLLFYQQHASDDLASLVSKVLEKLGLTLVELVAMHLKEVVEFVKGEIRDSQTVMGAAASAVDNLPVKILVAVPKLFELPELQLVVQAASDAGFKAELVLESECATASYTQAIRRNPPQNHTRDSKFILFDVGGGTGDVQTLEFASDATDGAKVELRNAGRAEGYMCGSERVNEYFRYWLKNLANHKLNGFKRQCAKLGLSEIACLYIASCAFEELKKKFTGSGMRVTEISIPGADGATEKRWIVRIEEDNMKSFFDSVIDEIILHIDEQIQLYPGIKTIVMPGGFGTSPYLRRRIRDHCDPLGITLDGGVKGITSTQPVSRGALRRYDSIKVRNIPEGDSFGIAAIEYHDPAIHTDATMANGRIYTDDYEENKSIVYERWDPITMRNAPAPRETPNGPRQIYVNQTWQLKVLEQGKSEFDLQIYWTKLDLAAHDPMRGGLGTCQDALVAGLRVWGRPITFTVNNLRQKGYKAVKGVGDYKGWIWQFYYRVLLEVDGANITVHLHIPEAADQPTFENGDLNTTNVQLAPDEEGGVSEVLVEEASNPFARAGV